MVCIRHNIIAFLTLLLWLGSFSLSAQGTRANVSQHGICALYVPNAFTPNGDNLNERFVVKHGEDCELLEYSIKIFDRWGRLIFESESARSSESWDGTFDGDPVKQGVYMFRITAKIRTVQSNDKAEIVNRQGSLVLIR